MKSKYADYEAFAPNFGETRGEYWKASKPELDYKMGKKRGTKEYFLFRRNGQINSIPFDFEKELKSGEIIPTKHWFYKKKIG